MVATRVILELVLHIGTTKTGTSSIQKFLANHDARLMEHGVLYPRAGRVHGERVVVRHVGLTLSILPVDRSMTGFDRILGLKSREERERFRDRFLEEFDSELRQTKARQIVISDEALYIFLKDDQIRELKALLDRYFDHVRVVAYVRDPASFAESAYSQHLKMGGTKSLDEFVAALGPTLSYWTKLAAWRNAFGPDSVDLREFSRKRLRGGDVVEDFCATFLDMDVSASADQRVVSANRSISPLGQALLLRINRHYAAREERRPVFFRTYVSKRFAGKGERLSAGQLADLHGALADEIRNLSADFFDGREIFESPASAAPTESLDEGAVAEAAVAMAAAAFVRGAKEQKKALRKGRPAERRGRKRGLLGLIAK